MTDNAEPTSPAPEPSAGPAADAAGDPPPDEKKWHFAGWGETHQINDLKPEPDAGGHEGVKLGQWRSTAICGNDITSSCLYVSALCAIYAGPYAPIALGLVAILLYLFRTVYAEVGSALPLNGGAYNVLLNTTTKFKASLAACLTLLSYIATAVISASEAMHYAHNLWGGLNVFWATVLLLGFFAFLNLIGITESANVAVAIFVAHITTLVVLSIAASSVVMRDPAILKANWAAGPPGPNHNMAYALFFGFSAALLGISGFESSANFIEEQDEGVFPKTLRNMWIAVAIFNPLISLLSLGLIPLGEMAAHKTDLLAEMGRISVGAGLQKWISLDAVLVLSGAVLTSYVGVIGLVRRMSLDRCLPEVLLVQNAWRKTNHWIVLSFFGLCCSILYLAGEIETLAGVYTISFLAVMALFAVGNMLLKIKRDRLPRAYRASWPAVVIALVSVVAGLIGNVLLDPAYVKVFFIYFSVAIGIVLVMFLRVQIFRGVMGVLESFMEWIQSHSERAMKSLTGSIQEINSRQVVFFTRGDNLANLNEAALYVLSNELTERLLVVHVYENQADVPESLAADLQSIDHVYPQLRIDLLLVKGTFGPGLVEALSKRLNVPKNYMFIGCPGDRFPHSLGSLGGVRLIV